MYLKHSAYRKSSWIDECFLKMKTCCTITKVRNASGCLFDALILFRSRKFSAKIRAKSKCTNGPCCTCMCNMFNANRTSFNKHMFDVVMRCIYQMKLLGGPERSASSTRYQGKISKPKQCCVSGIRIGLL